MARAIPREMKKAATSVAQAMRTVDPITAGKGQIFEKRPPSRCP